MSKDTNFVPNLSKRENSTYNRFITFHECSSILQQFFKMGFKSYESFKAIMTYYYPEINLLKLKKFWNCVGIEKSISEKVVFVFDQLKKE